jgi:DNA-binding transcriptional LysR family regulator
VDTRLLSTFLTLARTENFTAAAAELHLSQSTVTAQIKTLEKDLGARLFDRMPRGAQLTATGRRLLAEAAEVLEAEARLRVAAAGDAQPTGTVVVGAGETLCSTHLPGVIATLRRTHPDIDVHLFPAGTGAAVEGLRAGRLDIALLLEDEVRFADMTAEPVAREPLCLIGAPGHPLAAQGRPVTWEEIARESFFLHEEGCSYSDRVARKLLALPDARPRLTRFGSIETARSCVAAGLGLSVLPRATVGNQLREGSLAVVAGPQIPDITVQLVRHRGRWTSPAIRAVMDALACHFSSQPIVASADSLSADTDRGARGEDPGGSLDGGHGRPAGSGTPSAAAEREQRAGTGTARTGSRRGAGAGDRAEVCLQEGDGRTER